jgi:hypothetical protein
VSFRGAEPPSGSPSRDRFHASPFPHGTEVPDRNDGRRCRSPRLQ